MSKSYDPQGDAGMDSVQEQFRGETDGEDAHMELHIYEGDSAFVVRENGNKSLYGVQLPELMALFNDARTADGPEPVAQLGGAPDDLHNLIKVVCADKSLEEIGALCREVLSRRNPAITYPVPDGPAPAVSEAEVDAALGAWRAAPGLGVNKAIMRICLQAAQRARK